MIAIFNAIISGLAGALTAIISLLPASPFQVVSGIDNSWLAVINYWIPVNSMIAHIELYLVAVGTYYVIRVVLRWTKGVEG